MTERRSALIDDFNNRLLVSGSASAVLQNWCGVPIQAIKIANRMEPLRHDDYARLGADEDEGISYRLVHLACRGIALSHAKIWYRDGCLTQQMHDALHDTDIPFGLVVRSLEQNRETYAVTKLPSPFILEHQALLITGAGVPFGIVHERYTEDVLFMAGCSSGIDA